ncbi:DUF3108 domain-containing protein [candidate division KSB1 bacterium]
MTHNKVIKTAAGIRIDAVALGLLLLLPVVRAWAAPGRLAVGERLEYEVTYGPASAGTAVLTIADTTSFRGRTCYVLRSAAQSNRFFSTFYRVDDRAESLLDVDRLVSLRFEKHIREGKHSLDETIYFDPDRRWVFYPGGEIYETPPRVQDVLSALYLVRLDSLRAGLTFQLNNHTDNRNYPMEVTVSDRVTVRVPAGEFDCWVLRPMLRTAGLFKHSGEITVYVTADERNMPVLMKTKVFIGSVAAQLVSYRTGG